MKLHRFIVYFFFGAHVSISVKINKNIVSSSTYPFKYSTRLKFATMNGEETRKDDNEERQGLGLRGCNLPLLEQFLD